MWRDLRFEVDSELQIFCEIFHGNFVYSQNFCQKSARGEIAEEFLVFCFEVWPGTLFNLRVFAKNLTRGNRRRNTFFLLSYFLFNVWPGILTRALRLPTRLQQLHTKFNNFVSLRSHSSKNGSQR